MENARQPQDTSKIMLWGSEVGKKFSMNAALKASTPEDSVINCFKNSRAIRCASSACSSVSVVSVFTPFGFFVMGNPIVGT